MKTILLTNIFLLLSLSCYAQEFIAGKQYDTVLCTADTTQSYSLYLPSNYYNAELLWPVLYIFEPAARGPYVTKIFKPLAEKYGYIIIASNNSRNGSWDLVFNAAEAIFNDSFERYKLDTTRIYLTGFSGGSRAAVTIASLTNRVKGVIGCGAGFSLLKNHQPRAGNTFLYYGLVGTRDMNYLEMQQVKQSLDRLKIENRIHVFDGPHRWPPEKDLHYAFNWMEIIDSNNMTETGAKTKWLARADSLFTTEEYLLFQTEVNDIERLFSEGAPEYRLRDDSLMTTKAYKTEVHNKEKWQEREEEMRGKYLQALTEMAYTKLASSDSSFKDMTWWQNEVKILKKIEKSKDLYKSRTASRLLNMIWASCAENLWTYVQQNDLVTATNLTDLWLYINPQQLWPNWTAVQIYALNRDKKRTIKYINQAIDLGLKPTKKMLNNPNLDFIKETEAYIKLANLAK